MRFMNLDDCYSDPERVVVTAHRGFSGEYPENTMVAFQKAAELGSDLIEFDIRGTCDNVPVILHDQSLDRTSDGTGSPNACTLEELREFNFSWYAGSGCDGGCRLEAPAYSAMPIPTFQDVLEAFRGQVGMNIQVYETVEPLLSEICRLYDAYDMYEQGYLSMSSFEEAEQVRSINPRIELCILQGQGLMTPAALELHKAFGVTYIQPGRADVDPDLCQAARALDLRANMFFSNTDADHRRYIGYGLQGILTDFPPILLKTLRDLRRA